MCLKLLYILPLLVNIVYGHGHTLKQVLILSRHNIRSPSVNADTMSLFSPKTWPTFTEDPGYLTAKGSVMEKAMGKYFSNWLIKEKLLKKNSSEDVFVYSNNIERTIKTARAFIEGAGFSVDVYYKNTTGEDPVFYTVLKNDSAEFIQAVTNAMEAKLKSYNLTEAYLALNEIVDLDNSTFCQYYNVCDLTKLTNEVSLVINDLPAVNGSLQFGYLFVDCFLMAYYDGKSLDEVAWGELRTNDQWELITRVLEDYKDVIFRTKPTVKDLSSPLLDYLSDVFENGTKKVYVLVGHDTTIGAFLSSLNFKNYTLIGQYEKEPIGGKVILEKWYDGVEKRDLLRVRFVYQSTEQIRDGVEASLLNPPLEALLELEGCAVDSNGFCLWDKFIDILTTSRE